jgi:hypothetical protein
LRLGVVAGIAVSILTIISGLLLVPTYVLLTKSATAKQANLATIESVLSSSDEKNLSAHLAALSSDAAALVALGRISPVSATIRSALAIPRSGIMISGFSYTPVVDTVPGTLVLSGTAATRDALRSYQLALKNAPFSAAADLPVSAYAKDVDIPFTITITLVP